LSKMEQRTVRAPRQHGSSHENDPCHTFPRLWRPSDRCTSPGYCWIVHKAGRLYNAARQGALRFAAGCFARRGRVLRASRQGASRFAASCLALSRQGAWRFAAGCFARRGKVLRRSSSKHGAASVRSTLQRQFKSTLQRQFQAAWSVTAWPSAMSVRSAVRPASQAGASLPSSFRAPSAPSS
jgi:hypothetical protein